MIKLPIALIRATRRIATTSARIEPALHVPMVNVSTFPIVAMVYHSVEMARMNATAVRNTFIEDFHSFDSMFLAYVQPCAEYTCKTSKKCIPKSWICDGSIDCGINDDSDETADCSMYSPEGSTYFYPYSVFSSSEREHCDLKSGRYFKCADSDECLPISSKCDAHKDCQDGSDERGCACTCADQFSCQTVCQCLNSSRVCDGVPDCIDQTDERNCTCALNEYSCFGGGCINRTQLCDGMRNCEKNDDESHPDCTSKYSSLT